MYALCVSYTFLQQMDEQMMTTQADPKLSASNQTTFYFLFLWREGDRNLQFASLHISMCLK